MVDGAGAQLDGLLQAARGSRELELVLAVVLRVVEGASDDGARARARAGEGPRGESWVFEARVDEGRAVGAGRREGVARGGLESEMALAGRWL